MSPDPESRRPENRRKHRKSRNGCLVCKRRRVKCDEVRPRCGKCVFGNRDCSYGDPTPSSSTGHATPPATQQVSAVTAGTLDVCLSNTPVGAFNALHMALLFHATANMDTFMGLDNTHIIIRKSLEAAHVAPYLLDQLLALSSLHMSVTSPGSTAVFEQQAAALQNRALALFAESQEHVDANYISAFIFAALLGIHVLRNTLADHMQSIGSFVSAFVEYYRIHCGVRVVISKHWVDILESDLKPFMTKTEALDDEAPTTGPETEEMRSHLESSLDPSASSTKACLEALKWVQRLLDVAREDSSNPMTFPAVYSWAMLLSEDYIVALYQHRPEALAVLACYAAVLHKFRTFWVFGGSGAVLFDMIDAHVGPFWSGALSWPRHVVAGVGR